jgi:hypothetical protein
MGLYTNLFNQDADWSKFEGLRASPPYNAVSQWRTGQEPGGVLPGASRVFGRLMDDDWQHALFTRPELRDLTPDNIRDVLRNVMLYEQGVLTDVEAAYYNRLRALCRTHGYPHKQAA